MRTRSAGRVSAVLDPLSLGLLIQLRSVAALCVRVFCRVAFGSEAGPGKQTGEMRTPAIGFVNIKKVPSFTGNPSTNLHPGW